jgi:hypothetical protein
LEVLESRLELVQASYRISHCFEVHDTREHGDSLGANRAKRASRRRGQSDAAGEASFATECRAASGWRRRGRNTRVIPDQIGESEDVFTRWREPCTGDACREDGRRGTTRRGGARISTGAAMNRRLIEYSPDTETFEPEAFGDPAPLESEVGGSVFSEADEMELAADLLDVREPQELDRFLGNLITRAGRAAGAFVSSPTGQALGGILKDAARQVLPIAGRAIGGYLGGDRGGDLGARSAAAAGRIFGLELEGLSPEDREFEIARSFVRFAGETVRAAVGARQAAPPPDIARSAVASAARRFAPGFLRSGPRPLSGRWLRHGRNILVVNS